MPVEGDHSRARQAVSTVPAFPSSSGQLDTRSRADFVELFECGLAALSPSRAPSARPPWERARGSRTAAWRVSESLPGEQVSTREGSPEQQHNQLSGAEPPRLELHRWRSPRPPARESASRRHGSAWLALGLGAVRTGAWRRRPARRVRSVRRGTRSALLQARSTRVPIGILLAAPAFLVACLLPSVAPRGLPRLTGLSVSGTTVWHGLCTADMEVYPPNELPCLAFKPRTSRSRPNGGTASSCRRRCSSDPEKLRG